MNKIRIGIICPSEIAFRRFMPALQKASDFLYVGVAYPSEEDWNQASKGSLMAEKEKALKFQESYGGEIYSGYGSLINSDKIDAVYIPLPPALHHDWAMKALACGKHVFVEKPSTTREVDTKQLVDMASQKNLALHENYMFQYHDQIQELKKLMASEEIGDIRLIRAEFGFPKRASNDFRYNKELGGGALLDCGGYPLRLMTVLLGHKIKVDAAKLFYTEQGIDLYGSVQLSSSNQVAQVSFGMDNSYRCSIDIWGSKGTISTNRVFTAPEGFEVDIKVAGANEEKKIHVDGDDSFFKSIERFKDCIYDRTVREEEYAELLHQISLVEQVRTKGGN